MAGREAEMPDPPPYPALKALHPETSLSPAKLIQLQQLSTDALMNSWFQEKGIV